MEPIAPWRPGVPEPEHPRPQDPPPSEPEVVAAGRLKGWAAATARWVKAHMFLAIIAAAAVLTVIIWAAVGFS